MLLLVRHGSICLRRLAAHVDSAASIERRTAAALPFFQHVHITDQRKLWALLALLTLAVAIAVKTGHAAAQLAPIPRKTHGEKACSVFSLGLAKLRKLFARLPRDQVCDALRCLIGGERLANTLIGHAR